MQHQKFKNQFTVKAWEKLNNDLSFREAWAADDLDKAGLIADRLLIGETKSIGEARHVRRVHDLLKELGEE